MSISRKVASITVKGFIGSIYPAREHKYEGRGMKKEIAPDMKTNAAVPIMMVQFRIHDTRITRSLLFKDALS